MMTSASPSRRPETGFTLIELLIVISIVAIILALAVPSFRSYIELQRLRAVHDQVATDIQFARSEAVRLKTVVHFRVMPASGSTAACYVIYSDTNKTPPYSAACDCTQPAGSRCTAATTAEIRTVTVESWMGITLSTVNDSRFGVDPATGAMLLHPDDTGTYVPREFILDTALDSSRKLETVVGFTGRVRSCAPPGSSIKAVAC